MVQLKQDLKLLKERRNIMALEEIIKAHGGIEVPAIELYRDMFKIGEHMLQSNSKNIRDMVANPLIYMKNHAESKGQYRILFEDELEKVLDEASTFDFAITNGLTYFGRKNVQKHASKMFAMIFDLDGVGDQEAKNLFSGIEAYEYHIYPMPNYMVISGHGLHLYYLFDWEIPLYPNIKIQLKNFKYGLTRCIWNRNTSKIDPPQYQGINQGFRIAGGKTKIEGYKSKVFKLNEHPWTLNQLNEFVPERFRIDEKAIFRETKLSLEEAKRRYPDWYQRRVIDKMPKRTWRCKEALYEWWLNRIKAEARFGHRYFCVMMLAIYAMKCGISKERLEADAYALEETMTSLKPDEPFTKADIKSALECYDEDYLTFPIKDISQLTTIPITKNKRNGRTQGQHMEVMRAIQNVVNPDWRNKEGRPTKKHIILEWQEKNPMGTKYQCIKETGLDKKTVYKWWRS